MLAEAPVAATVDDWETPGLALMLAAASFKFHVAGRPPDAMIPTDQIQPDRAALTNIANAGNLGNADVGAPPADRDPLPHRGEMHQKGLTEN